MTEVNLGMSVGQYVGVLSVDLIPSAERLEIDRKNAYDKWDQVKDQWFPNEISNFLPLKTPLVYDGIFYRTVEHFYQAMKSQDKYYREAIAKCETPNKTKWLAAKLDREGLVREDWFEINVEVMSHGQRHRIETDVEFGNWLKSTRHRYLYEWNNWNDLFWGVCIDTGKGHNMLGRILMYLRDNVYFNIRRG